ncbi:D-tyrosyl-tRNA deacylase [Dichomitus squalens]|uniref:D-aminoacyl-tRNA deacylase n=1 Tax=Dichomitus squalens TaxID=114155 RepID=A0A4Q9QCH0_9APHY|nr:D-tyrosyl-tRNA deacylase [Dichomitus squalens]TBU50306.1 D-tyrosyl-tRNA deacylase [Dichomitus squalens]TBU65437.1 D-tyrosyl-tRNA deacylase [Dichomitus squalens]
MRAIVQRVREASVTVDNEVISSIGRGLMVLVGIGRDDTATDLESLSKQILSLKVFSDDASGAMWKKNVKDIDGEVLCVSQFTLFASAAKGKPDFHRAMATGPSRDLYASLLNRMGELYRSDKIKDGRFGAMMDVRLTNEGPVTFTLDSRKFEYVRLPLESAIPNKGPKGTPTASGKQTPRAQEEPASLAGDAQPAA